MTEERPNPEIEALRQELKRDIEVQKAEFEGELRALQTNVGNLKWLFMALVGIGGLILAVLARLADVV